MAPRARAGVCVSAPRGKSAPQCPSPRAPGGRQHEQADAGARREAVPELVPHSPGQPPSHLRPPPTAWSRKCPAAATPCQDPPPPPHHHPPTRSNRSGRHGQRLPPPYKTSRRIRNPSKRATGSRNGGIYAGRMPGCGERGEGRPRSRSSASGGFWCDLKWAGRGWEEKVGEGAGNGIVGSCVVCLSERGRGSGVEWSGVERSSSRPAVEWRRERRGGWCFRLSSSSVCPAGTQHASRRYSGLLALCTLVPRRLSCFGSCVAFSWFLFGLV